MGRPPPPHTAIIPNARPLRVHLKIKIPVTVRRSISKRSHEKIRECEQSINLNCDSLVMDRDSKSLFVTKSLLFTSAAK